MAFHRWAVKLRPHDIVCPKAANVVMRLQTGMGRGPAEGRHGEQRVEEQTGGSGVGLRWQWSCLLGRAETAPADASCSRTGTDSSVTGSRTRECTQQTEERELKMHSR